MLRSLSIYSDSQNYVYSGKFFLSRPLLQWKKRMKNLEKFIRVEQASEHKKVNFAPCKVKSPAQEVPQKNDILERRSKG